MSAKYEESSTTVSPETKRKFAAFYTPPDVTRILVDWAVQEKNDRVLDPSCGGCAFLESALDRLNDLGSAEPERLIYGVDIDPKALQRISALTGGRKPQFRQKNFLAVERSEFHAPFQAVVGNPPYLRPSRLSGRSTALIRRRLDELEISLSGRASLWAPFVAYATTFLAPDGRMAMVLPEALIQADYGKSLLKWLESQFRSIHLDLVLERFFEGTEEKSILLFGDGYGSKAQGSSIRTVRNPTKPPSTNQPVAHNRAVKSMLLSPESLLRYNTALQQSNVVRLGDIATIRIGVVTGANDFFVISEATRRQLGISKEFCRPILRRPRDAAGIVTTSSSDHPVDLAQRRHLIVVAERTANRDPALSRWIRAGRNSDVHKGYHCRNRPSWYSLPNPMPPEAILCPMGRDGPRILINGGQVLCTNNMFGLTAKSAIANYTWSQVALGVMSSFAQLSAELEGRTYGGGILKLEPSDAASVAIPILPRNVADAILSNVHRLILSGRTAAAETLVNAKLAEAQIISQETNVHFRSAVESLREGRHPQRPARHLRTL